MRFAVALGMSVIACGLSAPALAQNDALPCDAFARLADGSWQAIRNVGVQGPGRVFNVRQGALFQPGASFMGMTLAEDLDKKCPVQVEAAAAAATQVELPKYAAPDGNIDTEKFTCAQFADLPPDDAEFLGTWTLGLAERRRQTARDQCREGQGNDPQPRGLLQSQQRQTLRAGG